MPPVLYKGCHKRCQVGMDEAAFSLMF
jgi:hypothetical protein